MLQNYFRSFFQLAQNKTHLFWQQDSNWQSEDVIINFLELFTNEFNHALIRSSESAIELLKGIFIDIQQIKEIIEPEDIEVLQYFQFCSATAAVIIFTTRGLFTYAFDWLIYAVSDEMPIQSETDFKPERGYKYICSRNSTIRSNSEQDVIQWISSLFYYNNKFGGLEDFADSILPILMNVGRKNPFIIIKNEYYVTATCHVLSYTINNKNDYDSQFLSKILAKLYPKGNSLSRKLIAMQLAVKGANFINKSSADWAKEALTEFGNILVAHERLQLLSILCSSNIGKFIKYKSKLFDAIDEYHQFLTSTGTDKVMLKYETTRIFSIIYGLLIQLLEAKEIKYAYLVIGKFLNVSESKIIKQDGVFILPNHPKGILYGFENEIKIFNHNNEIQMPILFNDANSFLRTNITLKGSKKVKLQEYDRPGVIDDVKSEKFENTIINHYHFNQLINWERYINATPSNHSIVLIPGLQHPIQVLLLKYTGKTFPITVSFENPLEDRTIKKVFLWAYGTQTSHIEKEYITRIFESQGIEVHQANEQENTKLDFIKAYSDNTYDLIWLATHGEYQHFDPHNSYIPLNESCKVTLSELAQIELISEKRRLIVLNICDGATVASYDGLYQLGLGVTITNSKQASISHLWPITNICALSLGVLLAICLSEGKSYFDSYKFAICNMQQGKNHLLEILASCPQLDDDFLDRIRNNEATKLNKLAFYGSPVFYQ